MKHTVEINSNHVIEVHISGDVTFDDVSNLGQMVIKNATLLDDKGFPINILIDYAEAGNTEELAVSLGKTIAKNLDFHKIATINSNEANTKVVEDVAKATNIENKLRLFQTREQAEAWLSE